MNVLVVAAHPDDEVLGCGGTIARHTQKGDNVYVMIMAEGITSRSNSQCEAIDNLKLDNLAESADKANAILGVKELIRIGLPDNRMDSMLLLDIIKKIENTALGIKPEIVYTHHSGDLNIDHRLTHEAVITVFRPFPDSSVKSLLFFEVNSSTNWQMPGSAQSFTPNWFVDITNTIGLKERALECYTSEMRQYPHTRSIQAVKHLAYWRGSSIGTEAAEAFILGRHYSD